MIAVTGMTRVAGMTLVGVVTGRVVVTLVRIVHGLVVLRLVAVMRVVVLVVTEVAVARCASAVVILLVDTVLIAHTGLVSAEVLQRLTVRAGQCACPTSLGEPTPSAGQSIGELPDLIEVSTEKATVGRHAQQQVRRHIRGLEPLPRTPIDSIVEPGK